MNTDPTLASFWRRIGAMLYDTILVLALILLASLPVTYFFHESIQTPSLPKHLFQLYLLLIWLGYFVFFWHKYSQTPGMKVWKLTLHAPSPLSYSSAALRWLYAWTHLLIFPLLPTLWNNRTLADKLSHCDVRFHKK